MSEDEAGALLAGVVLALAGVVVWRVTLAAASGRIRPNGAIGLRTRATMASEEAWETGHRAALPVVQPLCLASMAAAVTGAVVGHWPPAGFVLVLVSAGLLVAAAVGGGVVAHRAARAATRTGG